jgi:hypothetical protein
LLRPLYPVKIARHKLIRKEGGNRVRFDVLGKRSVSSVCRDLSAFSVVATSTVLAINKYGWG